MNKSIIAAVIGGFVVVTALLCMNPNEKMYQKQKHFDTANDVLIQLGNNDILDVDKNEEVHETSAFKECLSKRKRLTYSQVNFQKMKIEKIEELDEQKNKSLLEDYNKLQERLSMPYKPIKTEPVRLDVKGISSYKDENGNAIENDFIIDLVMVDEGEGMVIDYYVQYYIDKDKIKEDIVNVKG